MASLAAHGAGAGGWVRGVTGGGKEGVCAAVGWEGLWWCGIIELRRREGTGDGWSVKSNLSKFSIGRAATFDHTTLFGIPFPHASRALD